MISRIFGAGWRDCLQRRHWATGLLLFRAVFNISARTRPRHSRASRRSRGAAFARRGGRALQAAVASRMRRSRVAAWRSRVVAAVARRGGGRASRRCWAVARCGVAAVARRGGGHAAWRSRGAAVTRRDCASRRRSRVAAIGRRGSRASRRGRGVRRSRVAAVARPARKRWRRVRRWRAASARQARSPVLHFASLKRARMRGQLLASGGSAS
jgi:hypothetical protein